MSDDDSCFERNTIRASFTCCTTENKLRTTMLPLYLSLKLLSDNLNWNSCIFQPGYKGFCVFYIS